MHIAIWREVSCISHYLIFILEYFHIAKAFEACGIMFRKKSLLPKYFVVVATISLDEELSSYHDLLLSEINCYTLSDLLLPVLKLNVNVI